MKRYLIPILTVFVLASGLVAGCIKSEATYTYRNQQFAYSVEMPASWTVVDKPVHWITGTPLKNTVGFRSKAENIWKADWVTVEVTDKPIWALYDERLYLGEYKVSEYGSRGAYLIRYRASIREEWRWIILVHHKGKLYEVTFSNEKAKDKVNVFIDDYGSVK